MPKVGQFQWLLKLEQQHLLLQSMKHQWLLV